MVDIKKIEELITIIEKSSFNEIEVREGRNSIRIGGRQSQNDTNNTLITEKTKMPKPQKCSVQEQGTTLPSKSERLEGKYIRSPMIGTFYHSAAPNSRPFVLEGQNIKIGDTLCIIEAMKIMNQIEAETSGIILEIIVKDGASVEYNQPLFLISNQ